MQREEINKVWDNFKEGRATKEEQALLESWYLKYEHTDRNVLSEEEVAERLAAVAANLPLARKTVKLWPRIGIAAAVTAITLGVWLYYTSSMNDIAPGRNTATLTLASGEVINLDTNKTSVVVTDSVKTPTMLTASTPRGGTYQVVLSDGTRVWLNADSKISFPSQFIGSERKIKLEGEGYFEVAHNKQQPFIVESNGQEVTVLGTHFNINAYKDEGSIKTTLLEGSVRVATLSSSTTPASPPLLGKEGTSMVLKPNQQAVVSGSNRIAVASVDVNEAMAWKNGEFIFNDEPLEDIMRRVARWYDVDVVYQDINKTKLFNGTISRFENISKVLDILQATGKVKFKVAGRKVYVGQ